MNPRPLGYEPNELPDCSTPRQCVLGTNGTTNDPNAVNDPNGPNPSNARRSERFERSERCNVARIRGRKARAVDGSGLTAGGVDVLDDKQLLPWLDQAELAARDVLDGVGIFTQPPRIVAQPGVLRPRVGQ